MTRYQISFKTDKTNGKYVERVLAMIYKSHGKLLDYLRTENVSLMLVDIDPYIMEYLKDAGYDIDVEPKIQLS